MLLGLTGAQHRPQLLKIPTFQTSFYFMLKRHTRFYLMLTQPSTTDTIWQSSSQNSDNHRHQNHSQMCFRSLRYITPSSVLSRDNQFLSILYLMILSRSYSEYHLRFCGWLNLEFSKRENIWDGPLKLFTRADQRHAKTHTTGP